MAKVSLYGLDGSKKEEIQLPDIFKTEYRPDLIQKSFNVLHSNKRQPYGSDIFAGTKHATASIGKGRGMSRVPRLTQGRSAALAPCVVGGRRAHPPKSEKNWNEKINVKEKLFARNSAIAATFNKELVTKRGHKFDDKISLPIIIDDKFEKIKKTKDVIDLFKKIGIYDDLIRSSNGKHIRAGKGKRRGRKYKIPKSVLIISENKNIIKSSDNLIGVDIVNRKNLNIEHLAPGGVAGRLAIFTKSAFEKIGGIK
ncbi:MAG: 50S ribosomal protein L4 [Candidatus Thermoplasmatota archaeon]|nr:50S ribosomal protein L4 [Candidatus Thermoplasmatota archaeon]